MKQTKILMTLVASLALSSVALAQQKLTIWLTGDAVETKIIQPAIDAFKAKNPNVTVEAVAIPWSDALTKFVAAVASKSGPDIISGGLSFGIELGSKGGMINLKEKYPDFVAQFSKTSNTGVLNAIGSLDGALYGMPYDLTVQLMYYRKDLLSFAPRNWNEFATTIEKTRASGKKGLAIQWGNANWLSFLPFVWQAGGTAYDAKCTKATINSPEAVRALQYYSALYTKYKSPTDGWPDLEQGLENGDYPLGFTGNWALVGIPASRPKLDGKWAVAKLPAGPTGKSTAFIGGRILGVMSYTKNPDLAVNFLKTVYSAQTTTSIIAAAEKTGNLMLPGWRSDFVALINQPSDRKSALISQLKDAQGPPNCPGWEGVGDDSVTKAVQAVIFQGADPKTALDGAAKLMDDAIAKAKR